MHAWQNMHVHFLHHSEHARPLQQEKSVHALLQTHNGYSMHHRATYSMQEPHHPHLHGKPLAIGILGLVYRLLKKVGSN